MKVTEYMSTIDGQRQRAFYLLDRMPIVVMENDKAALAELVKEMPGVHSLRLEVYLRDYREMK